MTRLLMRKLFRDERATAIIELALVAPIVALTVIGIVDLSNGFSRKLGLEQGAQRAIEKIMHWLHGGESTVVIAAAILLARSLTRPLVQMTQAVDGFTGERPNTLAELFGQMANRGIVPQMERLSCHQRIRPLQAIRIHGRQIKTVE